MGTTSSISMQSLGEIVQRAPAVGAKMWCLSLFFRLDALALSVIAMATWLAGWLGGWLGGCLSQPVLYQND